MFPDKIQTNREAVMQVMQLVDDMGDSPTYGERWAIIVEDMLEECLVYLNDQEAKLLAPA